MVIAASFALLAVSGTVFVAIQSRSVSAVFAMTSERQPQAVTINGVRVGKTPLSLKLADVPGLVVTTSSTEIWPPLDGWIQTDGHRNGSESRFAEIARFQDPSDEQNVRFYLRVRDNQRTTVAPLEILMGSPGREWFACSFGIGMSEGWLGTSFFLDMTMMDDSR